VFHAGTSAADGKVVTAGGRVLAVTALGDSFEVAREVAYNDIANIDFQGRTYRSDIGAV